MTQRLKDFTVLLEACTSAEAAARILQYLDTEISGDTVKRIVDDYKMRNDPVWVLGKEEFGEIRESRCSDASVEFYGGSLGYYMEGHDLKAGMYRNVFVSCTCLFFLRQLFYLLLSFIATQV